MTNMAFELAMAERGTAEIAGSEHNPAVVQYFADVGHAWVQDDETAWCAAFVGAMLKRAGMAHTGKLDARSYLSWGTEVPLHDARPGDLVIFWRGTPEGWQGHVGFFVQQMGSDIRVLGGNQRNAVGIQPYPVSRLLGVRRAPHSQQPTMAQVSDRPPRESPAQSQTLQAGAAQLVTAVGGGVGAVATLDGRAQVVAIMVACVMGLLAIWIMRERLRKWARGDR